MRTPRSIGTLGAIAAEVPVFAIIGTLLIYEASICGPAVNARFTDSNIMAYECQIAADVLDGDSTTFVRGAVRECPHLTLTLPERTPAPSWEGGAGEPVASGGAHTAARR